MNMYDIILKKRDGGQLSREELKFFVEGYTRDLIPDYQASALLMTFFINELDPEEVYNLTTAMRDSGDTIDLSAVEGVKVDKHSTGGVGDKTTLIAAPIAAAAGVSVAKMSGRGLGFTGGTIDKLESIPGFRTDLSEEEFIKQVNSIGIAITGQTGTVAPADKKIYALRDVTATVDSKGLIASSVMSKKLASGSDAIILDVKCGSGAFMHSVEEAEKLAKVMVDIGKQAGKKMTALITNMEQPLGRFIGNATEVWEAIDTLKMKGCKELSELSLEIAAHMIYSGGKAETPQDGYYKAVDVMSNGAALEKLRELIIAQGGNGDVIEDYSLLPKAEAIYQMNVENGNGYVSKINAEKIGIASQKAGAGRMKKGDEIDLSAGVYLYKGVGDKIAPGDLLLEIYGKDQDKIDSAVEDAKAALEFSEQKPDDIEMVFKALG